MHNYHRSAPSLDCNTIKRFFLEVKDNDGGVWCRVRERMLSSLVKEHQGRQAARKEQQEVSKLLALLCLVLYQKMCGDVNN